jgi:hypothetical protein
MSIRTNGILLNDLTAIYLLSLIANIVGMFTPLNIRDAYLHKHVALYILWVTITVLNAMGIVGFLYRRRWGVFIMILVPIFGVMSNLTYLNAVVPTMISIINIILFVTLIWVVNKKWSSFK